MPALRGDSTLSSSQCQDGPTPPAALDYFSAAWQEWSNSSCQLHLAPSQGEEIPTQSSIGTAQLRHGDTTAETQAGSAGAMSMAVVPEGLGTAVARLTGLSLPLTYRHLHSHTASKPPPDT